MNILLANLHWPFSGDDSLAKMKHFHFPLGLALIASQIRRRRPGHDLFVIDNYVRTCNDEEVLSEIRARHIDCILLSQFLGNYQYRSLKNFIKKAANEFPGLRIIIGGPLASTVPGLLIEKTEGKNGQMICVVGEGEETIINLLDCIDAGGDLKKVRGLCFSEDGVVFTGNSGRISDLDSYPPPAYELFDMPFYLDYIKESGRCWEISASRGCYGSCSYCKLVFGREIHARSARSLVKEMEDLHSRYGIERFNFVDDNFLNSEAQVMEFCDRLEKSGLQLKWRFQARADRLNERLLDRMISVGLYDISLGIESGSQLILDEMDKKMSLGKAMSALKSMPQQLDSHANFIVGMPSESPQTIRETIAFIMESRVRHVSAGILTPFPGTRVYETARSKGLIEDEDEYCQAIGPVYVRPYVNLTAYSDEQLLAWAKEINEAARN